MVDDCEKGQPQQGRLAKQAQKVDANHFFNLLTDPRMLETVEAQLPEHRERRIPPTLTLAMFLRQIMSADGSCQNAVNEVTIGRLLAGMNPGSVNTSGYCQARRRLPQEMVATLARQSGALLGEQTPRAWLWQGRHVKLVDGTTVSMPDTEENQACFPQPGQQAPGIGFPLARLVGVIALSNGAVLDAAMGPTQRATISGQLPGRPHLIDHADRPETPLVRQLFTTAQGQADRRAVWFAT